MITSKAKARRVFQLESLEGRTLLSNAPIAHQTIEVASIHSQKVRVIEGEISGSVVPIQVVSPTVTNVAVNGTGRAKGYGPISLSGVYPVQTFPGHPFVAIIPSGTATITSARFGTANLTYTGGIQIVSARKALIRLTGVVPSVTGAFAGATGTFTAIGSVNPKTGAGSLTFTVKLASA